MNKNISLLGSTGSIGTQTLDIIRQLNLTVIALSVKSNIKLLENQVREFKPKYVSIVDESLYNDLKIALKDIDVKVLSGKESLCELASLDESDMVINSVIGMAGLKPTLAAIDAGKTLGLANKESLVVAGKLLTKRLKFKNQLLPIDSEHSAIFQSIEGNDKKFIDKIILTASGGPFFGKTRAQLSNVTADEALKHPNWSMGRKISIDSATLMNKGLELIEASVLFDKDPEDIEILIHRESVIHSMVRYIDGSVIAQLSNPDMRLPIQYAITYPQRAKNKIEKIDFYKIKTLSFDKPDIDVFGCLKLAINASKKGNIFPCVLNAANEEAVDLFLNKKIKFLEIEEIVKEYIENQKEIKNLTLNDIFNVDSEVRNNINKRWN